MADRRNRKFHVAPSHFGFPMFARGAARPLGGSIYDSLVRRTTAISETHIAGESYPTNRLYVRCQESFFFLAARPLTGMDSWAAHMTAASAVGESPIARPLSASEGPVHDRKHGKLSA